MSFRWTTAFATLALVVGGTALAGCGGSGDGDSSKREASGTTPAAQETPAPARKWTSGYPSSIAVLGHSGATGENSNPDRPGVEVRENSWATGANPKVNSVNLRILEHNPAIKGHNKNYAEAGADINAVAAQADRLLASDPKPDLILIQVMDADLSCPVDRGALSGFRRSSPRRSESWPEGRRTRASSWSASSGASTRTRPR